MSLKISVVINTLNDERNIKRTLKSVKWADEIIVCDMHSTDKTVEIARNLAAKVIFHKELNYVEPARNFAISKASNKWIMILDADEEMPETLTKRLREIMEKGQKIDYVRIPRKNLIFGHFLKYSGWWPDYNIRFFKKGAVRWTDEIHRPPQIHGVGLDLEAKEQYAIIHYSYESISQFLEKANRYTTVQAGELNKQGYNFSWQDLLEKPLNEFLSRFFALEGYKDGLHGLVLSLLQAFSFLIVFLKLWEMDKFKEQEITLEEVQNQKDESTRAIDYWFKKSKFSGNFFEKLFKRKRC